MKLFFSHFCSKDHVHTEQCVTHGIRLLVSRFILPDFWIAEIGKTTNMETPTNHSLTPCIVDTFDLIISLW